MKFSILSATAILAFPLVAIASPLTPHALEQSHPLEERQMMSYCIGIPLLTPECCVPGADSEDEPKDCVAGKFLSLFPKRRKRLML